MRGVLARVRADGHEVSKFHADRLIGMVAAEQDGLITWEQLAALGLRRGAIEHRVRRGVLVARHRHVFSWGVALDSPWAAARAAVLTCGAGAFVTHHAALGLIGIRRHPTGPVDVTVVGRRIRRQNIRSHRIEAVHGADVHLLRAIPVSTPARALLEIAPELTARELADAVEQAQVKRLVTKGALISAIERSPRRAGVTALRALAEDQAFTRSLAERKLVALVRAARLPEPVCNVIVAGWEVDALWQRERVVLEFDSYGFHATRAAFERDRRKTADLTRNRYVVLRTTWSELTSRSHALVARTAEALALSCHASTS